MPLTCAEAKRKLDIIKKEAESFKILLRGYAQHGKSETLDELTEHRRRLESLSPELRRNLEENLGIYRFHVSYAKLPGVAELEKKFSGENSVSVLFDSRAWKRHSSCAEIDETPGERVFRIVERIPAEFRDKRIEDIWDELAAHFECEGYRFAIETEAVEFADAQPDLQRKNWILALGSSWGFNDGGRRYVATLYSGGQRRLLHGLWVGRSLGSVARARLLLVRK